MEESLLASFVYDAVWVFANALDIVLQQNEAALETFGTEANARYSMLFFVHTWNKAELDKKANFDCLCHAASRRPLCCKCKVINCGQPVYIASLAQHVVVTRAMRYSQSCF